jgi:hypothetical protein
MTESRGHGEIRGPCYFVLNGSLFSSRPNDAEMDKRIPILVFVASLTRKAIHSAHHESALAPHP